MEKEILLGKTPVEIQEVVDKLELPKFTGKQLVDWIYHKHVTSFDDMSNLSKKSRELLAEHYEVGLYAPQRPEADCRLGTCGCRCG